MLFKSHLAQEGPLQPSKPHIMNFLGLPTHLPNAPETVLPVSVPSAVEAEALIGEEEVQQQQLPTDSVVYIPGTTISLQTDEDIAKWIEERRKKWPTKKNVQQKEQEEKEKEKKNHHEQLILKKRTNQDQDQSQGKQPITKKRKQEPNEQQDSSFKTPSKKQICKFYEKNKKCRYGTKCRNLHESSNGGGHSSEQPKSIQAFPTMKIPRNCVVKGVNGVKVLVPQRYKGTNNSSSLFANLVQQDKQEFENKIVLEFIQFLDTQRLINHDIFKS